jgi:hypothetical protein
MIMVVTIKNYNELPSEVVQVMGEICPYDYDDLFDYSSDEVKICTEYLNSILEEEDEKDREHGIKIWEALINKLYIDALIDITPYEDNEKHKELIQIAVEKTFKCFEYQQFLISDSETLSYYLDYSFYSEIIDYDLERAYIVENYYIDYKGTVWILCATYSTHDGWLIDEVSFENTHKKTFEKNFSYTCES